MDQRPTWADIWKKAKAHKLNYNTFKNHMERLIKDKIIQVEIDKKKMPPEPVYVFDKDRLRLDVMRLEDIANFVGEAPRQHFIDQGLYGEQLYISDDREFMRTLWTLDKHEEEIYEKWRTATFRLERLYHSQWKSFILDNKFVKEKATIIKYEEALFDYYNLHFEGGLSSEKAELSENEKILFQPLDYDDLKITLDEIRVGKFPRDIVQDFPQDFPETLQHEQNEVSQYWKNRLRTKWSEHQLAEKQRLERFLSENERLYEQYKKQLLYGPKFCIVLPFFGFYGYQEKRARMLRTLPPSVSLRLSRDLVDLSSKHLAELEKGVRSSMQNANKHEAAFACNQCMRIFKTRDKCEQHIRKTEKILGKSQIEELVIKMPGSYYEEALKEISSIKEDIGG
jgi:hypothetical protein